MYTKKLEKKDLGFAEIDIWSEDFRKENPVKKEHIGKPVLYASDPKSKKYTLVRIYKKGSVGFPEGGFSLNDPSKTSRMANLKVGIDEVVSIPQKKKKRV